MADEPKNVKDSPPAGAKEAGPLALSKDIVELAAKGILGFAAICFVCGIIVVNLYLREFGVASFSLFRVSYITAGVWTFSPIVLAALLVSIFCFAAFQDVVLADSPRPQRPKWKDVLAAAFLALTVVAMLFSTLKIHFTWKWILGIAIGFLLGVSAVTTPIFLGRKERSEKMLGVYMGFTSVVGFFFYLIFLAPALYKEVPAAIGGGAGTEVVFVVPAEKQELAKAAGLTFAEPPLSKPVTLLIETDKTYVVAVGDPKTAVTLSADLVSAIRHLPPQK